MEAILNELIDSYREDIVSMTKELITFPSVFEESENEQEPFGKPINDALLAVLGLAEEMGFVTRNYDGYVGTVQWGDAGKQIGILSHIDVVPVGTGWSYPPFEGTEVDGALYGRGSVDDKGPLVAALFAMKAVRDSKLPVKNHVRHIIGADEESGMRCLQYYLQREEAPPDPALEPHCRGDRHCRTDKRQNHPDPQIPISDPARSAKSSPQRTAASQQ
jgi:succinyl-diaminopimelate desuccinylase